MNRSSDQKGALVAMRPDGALMWPDPPRTGDRPTSHTTPAIASNHTVFVTTNYPAVKDAAPWSMIWVIDFNGFHEWRQQRTSLHFTPVTLTPDNLVLFASYGFGKRGGTIWCLTMMGQTRWSRSIGRGARAGVAYGLDKHVRVFDEASGVLYVYDLWGELMWQHACGKPVSDAPLVSRDNVTYVRCDGKVTALDAEGKPSWGPTPFASETPMVLGPGGALVTVAGGRTVKTLR